MVESKKLVATHLFTIKKVNSFRHARQDVVTAFFIGSL